MKLSCEDLLQHLSDYLDQELDQDLMQAAQEHLASCENCQVVLDSTRQTILLYKQQTVIHIPAGRKNGLYHQILQAFSSRSGDNDRLE